MSTFRWEGLNGTECWSRQFLSCSRVFWHVLKKMYSLLNAIKVSFKRKENKFKFWFQSVLMSLCIEFHCLFLLMLMALISLYPVFISGSLTLSDDALCMLPSISGFVLMYCRILSPKQTLFNSTKSWANLGMRMSVLIRCVYAKTNKYRLWVCYF